MWPHTARGALPDAHAARRARAAHPQYLGSSLCITAAGLALHDAAFPGHDALPLWWVACYVLTGLAEEGLCHSVEPFAPLPSGADPLLDASSRPIVTAEAVRLLLMAPLVLLRWAACVAVATVFIVLCRLAGVVLSARRADAAHASLTRLAARATLLILGFSVSITGQGAAGASPVVANCLSYIDVLLLSAAFGPLTPLAPLPKRGVPLLSATLSLAGVSRCRGLAFPEAQRSAGGCVLPFDAAAWPAGAT